MIPCHPVDSQPMVHDRSQKELLKCVKECAKRQEKHEKPDESMAGQTQAPRVVFGEVGVTVVN